MRSTATVSAAHSGGGFPLQNVGAAQSMASARLNRRKPSVFESGCVPRLCDTEKRAGPGVPCLVVITMTPFAADEPQLAAADEPSSKSMLALCAGLGAG